MPLFGLLFSFLNSCLSAPATSGPKPEPKILFQQFFKSIGPRTYVAQLKEAANGNHFLVLTEGKRDDKINEVRKSRVFIYSEDFVAFFRLMQETAVFIKANPLDDKVKTTRDKVWAKKAEKAVQPVTQSGSATAAG